MTVLPKFNANKKVYGFRLCFQMQRSKNTLQTLGSASKCKGPRIDKTFFNMTENGDVMYSDYI